MKRVEHTFLVRVAELLHRYGTPANRLERVLGAMATALGIEAAFLSTPTSMFVSFGRDEDQDVRLLRVEPGEVDLGKLIEFDELMERVEHGRFSVEEGLAELDRIEAAPRSFGLGARAVASAVVSGSAARILGGGLEEVVLSVLLGPLLLLLGHWIGKHLAREGLFEPLAAFLVALLSMIVAREIVPLDDSIVTLATLIFLLPGLTLTVGLNELATRHLVSGTARIAGAATTFFTLLLGVGLAWRLGEILFAADGDADPAIETLAPWTEVPAVLVAPFAFAVLLGARRREFGVIFATGVAGFLAARYGALTLGPDLGTFLGALVVGLASNAYARIADRPSLVPSTPGILLLVPGSIGYRSLTSFLRSEALEGMEWAFQTGLVAIALVGGLLFANLLLPPRRVL